MTPEAAIYDYLSGFGIPAYASSSVPSDAAFPYLTYDLATGEFFEGEVNMPVNVWYRTESEEAPNAKVREIFHAIGYGGVMLRTDDGSVWVKRGRPWSQAITVEGEDEKVKRRYVNLNLEFFII